MEKHIIDFVRENPIIYDKNHESYKNQLLKDKKWNVFAKEMRVPVDKVKKRWKSMRDRFYRVRKMEANSNCAEKITTYKYQESLKFLCDIETGNPRTENFSPPGDSDELLFVNKRESPFEPYENVLLVNECDSADENSCFAANTINDTLRSNSVSTPVKRKPCDTIESEILNVLKAIKTSTGQSVTPFRTFLESVALTVENANFNIMQLTRLQISILQAVQDGITSTID